jgi:hypothetical protein
MMAEDPPTEPPEMVGAVFDAISDSNRRYILYYLRDRKTATLGELATVVASWKRAREPESEVVTNDDRKQVLASLHHADLPYLDDVGFVEYDFEAKTVAFEPQSEIVNSMLDDSLVYERRSNRETENDSERTQPGRE